MKTTRLVITIVYCLLLVSCHNADYSFGETYNPKHDDQPFFDKLADFYTMAASENGYYFLGGPYNNFIYFVDKKTFKPIILCNKPNCLHEYESDPIKISSCNACVFGMKRNMIYNNAYLYVTDKLMENLYRISEDGTSIRRIYKFNEHPDTVIIHRGYIYFSTNDEGTVFGEEHKTKSTIRIYRIGIDNLNLKPELIYEHIGIYARLIDIIGYGENVYFAFGWNTDFSLQQAESILLKYSTVYERTTKIVENIGNFSIANNLLLYYDIQKKKYRLLSLSDSTHNTLDILRGHIEFDGKYIYCDTYILIQNSGNDTEKRHLIVYDLKGAVIQSFDIDGLGNDGIYGGDSDYLFIPDNHSRKNEYGEIVSLWYIDKRKLETGNATLERIYEFIPESQFVGIVSKE